MNYSCHAFNAGLLGGKASGELEIINQAFYINVSDHRLILPLEGLIVRMGGAQNRLIMFNHKAYPDWEFYTADQQLLKHPCFTQYPDLNRFIAQTQLTKTKIRVFTFALLSLLIILPVLFFLRFNLVTGLLASHVPPAWEEKIGESVLAQYQLSNQFMPSEIFQNELEVLTKPLLAVLEDGRRYSYNFYIVHDSTLNAFALPGGSVIIHTELILKASSAEELLGVIGHEIAHVEGQHGIRNVIGTASLYTAVSFLLGDSSGLVALVSSAAPYILNQTYSRQFETDADIAASQLLEAANINPNGLLYFFEKIMREEQKILASLKDQDIHHLINGGLDFLSSHPSSQDRIKKLQLLVRDVQAKSQRESRPYRDLSVAFRQLQSLVAEYATQAKP